MKKAGFLTLTVNEDMTLSTSDVVSVYAIHVGEGDDPEQGGEWLR